MVLSQVNFHTSRDHVKPVIVIKSITFPIHLLFCAQLKLFSSCSSTNCY